MKDLNEHWNKIYKKSDEDKLGWYETDYSATLKLLEQIPDWKELRIFMAGAGVSGMIDYFLDSEVNLIINDMSSEVIDRLKSKYDQSEYTIIWNNQDITTPLPSAINDVDIWIDRAVLHFITGEKGILDYFNNVKMVVRPGGFAIFAEFSKSGVTKCAGLDVRRYDISDFKRHLSSFQLISSQEYTYINPSGDSRPYIYALFQKKSTL
jgi:SAM-dependent methyltransferase